MSAFCIHPVPTTKHYLLHTKQWCGRELETVDGILKCPVHGRNYMYDGVTPERALELWPAKRDTL